jgi:tRNA-2-methylthio-N6-dimethylallyladenosine synthase
VLLEKRGKRPGQLVGKSPWLQAVQVDAGDELLGEIVPVTFDFAGTNSLFGTLAEAPARERAIA